MPGLMTPNPVFFQLCKVRQSKIPLEQFKSFYLFILTKVHTLFRFPIFTKCHFSGARSHSGHITFSKRVS